MIKSIFAFAKRVRINGNKGGGLRNHLFRWQKAVWCYINALNILCRASNVDIHYNLTIQSVFLWNEKK